MKKRFLLLLICFMVTWSFVGCSNTNEYHDTLFQYYGIHSAEVEGLGQEIEAFSAVCLGADLAEQALNELAPADAVELYENSIANENANFAKLEDYPSEAEPGYEIAKNIHEAFVGIQAEQSTAYSSSQVGGTAVFAMNAAQYYEDFKSAVDALGQYFESIEYHA